MNKESIIEHGVAEKIITILGEHAVDTLVEILLVSPTLCSFKVIRLSFLGVGRGEGKEKLKSTDATSSHS